MGIVKRRKKGGKEGGLDGNGDGDDGVRRRRRRRENENEKMIF